MTAVVGPAGTGKTTMLNALAETARSEFGAQRVFFASHPRELVALAKELVELGDAPITIVDDVEARALLNRCASALFAMEWEELLSGTLDPEIAGLRSPERFLDAAFRLFRKLRDAAIAPSTFLERALAGATHFYANPPNLAHPDLILGTKETYRDSLDVDSAELERQRRREIDLTKILARLYREYVDLTLTGRMMTARDAIAFAADLARSEPERASVINLRHPRAFIDEAQDMSAGSRALLEVIYGKDLRGVTLAGDPDGATTTFEGARPELAFAGLKRTILKEPYRNAHPRFELYRAKDESDEARYIAAEVRARVDGGTPCDEIALIFRSVGDVHRYEEALLDRDIPVAVTGDVNVFCDRRALDALALLWNLWDPFEHEYLLRTLAGPAMALSDATLAMLCAEPPDAQAPLFEMDEEPAPTSRRGRFDPRRDLRLGWNVLYGSVDSQLTPEALERVRSFRAMRASWVEALPTLTLGALVLRVWNEGLALAGPPGSARAQSQALVLRRLFERLTDYADVHPNATLGDVLAYARLRAASDLESCETDAGPGFVQLRSVEAARGRSFDTVVIADARAGSFPRWYVPDAFLFSPKFGMIPKDNAGDARASRTAKFSYYIHANKILEAYNAQERRAFNYAVSRARREVLVSAAGRPTRGITAPEFLAELQSR